MVEFDSKIFIIIILIICGIVLFIYNNTKSKNVDFELETKLLQKQMELNPGLTKHKTININKFSDGFFKDKITREDNEQINNPLKYPYTRLPRYILDQYKDSGFYESGAFGSASNYFDDSEKIVGNLIVDANYPSFPLFEKPSATNRERYFYYTIDTRLTNDYKIKIPLNNIKVNGRQRNNVVENGIEQLNNDDSIEIFDYNFPPNTVFSVKLYPRQSGLYYNPYLGQNPNVSKMSSY